MLEGIDSHELKLAPQSQQMCYAVGDRVVALRNG